MSSLLTRPTGPHSAEIVRWYIMHRLHLCIGATLPLTSLLPCLFVYVSVELHCIDDTNHAEMEHAKRLIYDVVLSQY